MELPDNGGYLPTLAIELNIDQNGNIHHKRFTKPASKGITLNVHSHHPRSRHVAKGGSEGADEPPFFSDQKKKSMVSAFGSCVFRVRSRLHAPP